MAAFSSLAMDKDMAPSTIRRRYHCVGLIVGGEEQVVELGPIEREHLLRGIEQLL